MLATEDEGSDFWESGVIPPNLDNLMIRLRVSFDEVIRHILWYVEIDHSTLICLGLVLSFE